VLKKLALAALPAALMTVVATAMPAAAVGTDAGSLVTARGQVISLDSVAFNDGAHATIDFTYRCNGTPFALLWISLKQPTSGVQEPWDISTEGTSAMSSAWDSEHVTVPCSSNPKTVQHASFTVEDEYGVPGDFASGPVFVQLCLTLPAGNNLKALGPDFDKSHADHSFKLALRYTWVDVTV